jgi:formylglycine-generating enzyme required for sulfatase activity
MFLAGILFFICFQTSAQTVNVPGGNMRTFWIAPKDDNGPEQVKVPAFRAHAAPATNSEFLEFVRKNPEWRKTRARKIFVDHSYLAQFRSDLKLAQGISGRAPVSYVSYFAAQAFCESLGMRLPTTVEWEYMAAASETKADASGDSEFLDRILEWYAEPRAREGLPDVKRRKPNFYGIYDLHGLTWEWVEDFNSNLVTGESREDGSLNRNLFCGAGAMSGGNKENYAGYMRFAFRSSLKGKSTAWNLGFRCVKEGN